MGKGLEQTFIQSRRCWSRSLVQAGGALRWSWQASHSTRWSSIYSLHTGTGSKQVCMLFKSRILVTYSRLVRPTGFQAS